MKWMQTTSMVIVAVGVMALVYGGISYYEQSPDIKIGDMEVDIRDRRNVDFPIWLGVGCIIVGGAGFIYSNKYERDFDSNNSPNRL